MITIEEKRNERNEALRVAFEAGWEKAQQLDIFANKDSFRIGFLAALDLVHARQLAINARYPE